VLRAFFNALGGYRTSFVHMVEEPEFCLRMLAAGYVVRLGRAPALHHFESPSHRVLSRNVRLLVRNQLLDAWHNTPASYLPGRVGRILARSAFDSLRWRHPGAAAQGAWEALRDSARADDSRVPVSPDVWRLLVELRKRGPLRLEEIEARLPPLQAAIRPSTSA
jgi:GT2 family glycosyltransferase